MQHLAVAIYLSPLLARVPIFKQRVVHRIKSLFISKKLFSSDGCTFAFSFKNSAGLNHHTTDKL